ncbi:PASTA domain-containing protein [Pseudoduganella sp. RAF53_2]
MKSAVRQVRARSSKPAGTIFRQSLESDKRCAVVFFVSDGSLVRVPDVRTLPKDEAINRLQSKGLGTTTEFAPSSSTDQAGKVITQKPRAGNDVPLKSTVYLIVGPILPIDVPAVVGQTFDEAKQQLNSFDVSRVFTPGVAPEGNVISQNPEGHTKAMPGSTVKLTLSDGNLVEVPGIVGDTRSTAQTKLEQARLLPSWTEAESEVQMGSVISQDPAPPATASRNSTVQVQISAGLVVPSLVGSNFERVLPSLKSFVIEQEYRASERQKNEILSQSPPAGQHVSAHTVISLKLSNEDLVFVPPVLGKTLADARSELQSHDLVPVVAGLGFDNWEVKETVPAANQVRRRGETIAIKLSVPWWVWAGLAGGAALVSALGHKVWRHFHPNVTFTADIAPNVEPVKVSAKSVDCADIELCAGLTQGPVTIREHEETTS